MDIKNSNTNSQFDMTGFYNSYLSLCSKYQFLIFMAQGKMYRDQMINLDFLSSSFSLLCIGSVEKLPYYEKVKDKLADAIYYSGNHWLDKRQNYDKQNVGLVSDALSNGSRLKSA